MDLFGEAAFRAVKNANYDTDLSDAQWEFIHPMLPKPSKRGRPPVDRRRVLNAILYVLKGGTHWRLLPKDMPNWKTTFHVFRQWTRDKTWAALNDTLRTCVRLEEGRKGEPSAAILDSQSVKSDGHGGDVGYDAAKHIKGRKRHLLVDMLGLILGVKVTPANRPEREGGKEVLERVAGWFARLRKIWVDGGYSGEDFAEWVKLFHPKAEVEVVKRAKDVPGFQALPKRWIVERTFGWLMRHRRLARDYERTESSAEAWIHLAMIRLQLRRLA